MNVLITGASRGLGRCLAQVYLEDGHTVFAGVRREGALAPLKERFGDRLRPLLLEVRDTGCVNRAAAAMDAELDVLINNAAIHSESSFEPLEDTNLDDCVEVLDVNAVGPLRVMKAFLPKVADGGKMVNISSESGSIGGCRRDREFDYCMSKAALNMGCKLMQNYVKGRGIKVLAVQPGWMRTDMGGPHADLDPYETACTLVNLFGRIQGVDGPIFIDNRGVELPW